MAVQIMAVPNAASARTPLSLCRSDRTIRAAVHIEYARAGVFGLTWQRQVENALAGKCTRAQEQPAPYLQVFLASQNANSAGYS
jgi:hypothetical protein